MGPTPQAPPHQQLPPAVAERCPLLHRANRASVARTQQAVLLPALASPSPLCPSDRAPGRATGHVGHVPGRATLHPSKMGAPHSSTDLRPSIDLLGALAPLPAFVPPPPEPRSPATESRAELRH
eukprot:2767518-Prymnesium_polylepis.1